MGSNDFYELTQRRLERLGRMNDQSLEQLAVKSIAAKISFFLDRTDKPLENLSGSRKNKILQKLSKRRCLDKNGNGTEFKIFLRAFPILLSQRTTSLELNGFLSFCPNRFQNSSIGSEVSVEFVRMLRMVKELAPSIRELTVKKHTAFSPFVKAPRVNPEIRDALGVLSNLNSLRIELYSFTIIELVELCRKLPCLQFVHVALELDSADVPTGSYLRRSLASVKVLLMQVEKPSEFSLFRSRCIQHLPDIEVVQFHCSTSLAGNSNEEEIKFDSFGFPGKSSLRHLYIDLHKSPFPLDKAQLMFPKANCLKIAFRRIDRNLVVLETLLKFSNIHTLNLLHLDRISPEVFKALLDTHGKNLHTLILSNQSFLFGIDFNLLFDSCPYLEKLSLVNVFMNKSAQPVQHFSHLKELEWCFLDSDFLACRNKMALASILSAPRLESVKLQGFNFKLDDLDEITSLIRRQSILTKLHTFHIWLQYSVEEVRLLFSRNNTNYAAIEDDIRRRLAAAAQLLNTASAHAPSLTDLKYCGRYRIKRAKRPCRGPIYRIPKPFDERCVDPFDLSNSEQSCRQWQCVDQRLTNILPLYYENF